jgi:hypothetical protein
MSSRALRNSIRLRALLALSSLFSRSQSRSDRDFFGVSFVMAFQHYIHDQSRTSADKLSDLCMFRAHGEHKSITFRAKSRMKQDKAGRPALSRNFYGSWTKIIQSVDAQTWAR